MKRQIISFGLMLAAAFTLTNCAKEIANPNEQLESAGVPFEIVATTVDTKTVNDGMSTSWAEGDAINLFHAVAETDGYVVNGTFNIKNVETGLFTGELSETLESDKTYDWYALYPYSDKVKTPAAKDEGYTFIGYRNGINQSGYNSMASLVKSACPLYGVVKSVPAGDIPTFEMNHLSSLVAIKVTNANDDPLTVTEASLTAAEDIVGSYYIDFTKNPVMYTKSSDSYVSETATVKVTSEATALEKGQSATLYLPIKPFTAAVNSELLLSVNGYEKKLKMTEAVTFSAGKIKTLNFSYDKKDEPVVEGDGFSGDWLITGVGDGKMYAASAYETGNNLGTIVQIAIEDDKIKEVDGLSACKMTVAKVANGTYAGMYTIRDTKNQYLYAASNNSNQLKAKSSLDANCYWDIKLDTDGTYSIVASKSENRNTMQYNVSSKLFSCYASASQAPITLYPYSMVVPDLTPRIKVTETSKEVEVGGATVSFAYTLANLEGQDVSFVVSDINMLSVTAEGGVVSVVVKENTGEPRSATITLSCGDAEKVVLSISQDGVPMSGGDIVAGDKYTYTFTSKQFESNGTKQLGDLLWKIEGDGGYWGWDSNGKGQQLGSGSKPYTSLTLSTEGYTGGVKNVVVNTSGASSTNATLSVKIGGVSYGQVTLSSSAKDYTFSAPTEGMQTGTIELLYKQTSKKAIYIKSITINN